jgi:hypothetical protein
MLLFVFVLSVLIVHLHAKSSGGPVTCGSVIKIVHKETVQNFVFFYKVMR